MVLLASLLVLMRPMFVLVASVLVLGQLHETAAKTIFSNQEQTSNTVNHHYLRLLKGERMSLLSDFDLHIEVIVFLPQVLELRQKTIFLEHL